MSMLDKQTPTTLGEGINKDLNFQNQNQVTFALNTIRNAHDGGRREYQSEPGNELVESLPTGHQIMGTCYGINNEVYIIAVSPGVSTLIGIFKEGKFTKVVDSIDLGNSVEHPITIEFKIRNGCQRVIYWCDGFSKDKWFNFDDQDYFKDGSNWDPNKFNFVPNIIPPKIDLVSVNDYGGQTPVGSYYFQLEVLDKNENSIYKTDITPQTVIYDESQTDNYYNIDGALNTPQYDTAVGGVPITNKSITLRFYNLSTDFSYLKVNVARQIAGTQVIDAHTVAQLIPIGNSELTWTYIGYDVNSGDSPIDYTSMLVNNVSYDSAYVMEQVQGRLLRANLRQTVRDYSEYQKKASLIAARWLAKTVDLEKAVDNTVSGLDSSGSPKNPRTYWESLGFQGDEIYGFSIQYLHRSNGEWSPCFPLIARGATATDLEELTVVSNSTSPLGATEVWLSDVEHIPENEFTFWNGEYEGSQIQRWKVFNTADFGGVFGYHECNATYPDIQTCDGELIWGVDSEGNEIFSDTKIRLFRFPDRKFQQHYLSSIIDGVDTNLGFVLGVEFDNIEYPSDDIIGHRFCYTKRDEFNKTVVDSGWIGKPLFDESDNEITLGNSFSYEALDDSTYARYNSTNVMFNKKLFNADYLKINKAYRGETDIVAIDDFDSYPSKIADNLGEVKVNVFEMEFDGITNVDRTNFKILNSVYCEPRSLTNNSLFPAKIKEYQGLNGDSVLNLNYPLESLTTLLGAEQHGEIIDVPENFQYALNYFYGYKKVNNKPFERVTDLQYNYINFNYIESTDLIDNKLWGGDTLLVQCAPLRETRSSYGDNPANQTWECVWYKMFWEEQQVNASLRHGGFEPAFTYYKGNNDTLHFMLKISELSSTGNDRYELFPRETVIHIGTQLERTIPEYWAYNKDYVVQQNQFYKTTLPFNYDYCTDCLGEYTTRIIFSPKSFDEERFDLYRVNLTNDYVDIPGHRGPIRGIKYKNNQLIVHCEDGSFILRPNPQSIATDLSSVYLTTGDFLSIPPAEMIQTDVGYAGCQSKQHQCDTPFGWCWIDQRRGEIFKFDNNLENISRIGLEQWFKENLPSETKNAVYQTYEINYPHNATTSDKGYGIIMYYDPRFKRLLISKKDYLPINLQERPLNEGLHYIIENDVWEYLSGGINVPVDYGYVLYFENKSWTLSFSLEENQWWSWHSYRPITAFSDEINYYTTSVQDFQANKIWRHKSKEKFQNYYGTKYDMIIEWMNFDIETDSYYGLSYTGYSLQWDSTNKQWKTVEATFNKGVFYNFDQSSGLVTLSLLNQNNTPYQNVTLPKTTKYVIKTDNNYKISGIYDIATGSPVMTNDWNLVNIYNAYIDVVPNIANLNSTLSNYYTGALWDKFVFNRLYYKPNQDYKKVLILAATKEYKSIR